jgi:hypothetical protein
MRTKIIGMLLLLILGFCGCSSRHSDLNSPVETLTVPEKRLLAVTNGESFWAITNMLGIAARHEFTVHETNGNYTLVSCYYAGGDDALWLVFHDKTLMKIIEPFSFPELLETYPYQGTTATRIKSWDIDDPGINQRVQKVIDAPALTPDKIANKVNSSAESQTTASRSGNLIPAIFLSGILGKMAPQVANDYVINEDLLERYNGCAAKIGMDTNAIEKLYGKPLRVFTVKDGGMARIYAYGEMRELQVNPQLVFRGLAVVSDVKGQVTAVYSGGFFSAAWKSNSAR